MPLDLLLNRDSLSTQRTKINAAITQSNTNVTDLTALTAQVNTNTSDISDNADAIDTNTNDIATNTGNIQTNTNDIATNTAAIALKQNANAETTLRYRIVPLSTGSNVTVLTSYANQVLYITPSTTISLILPAASTMAGFSSLCVPLWVCNSAAASDNITISPSGCTLEGATAIAPGENALLMPITSTVWLRMF